MIMADEVDRSEIHIEALIAGGLFAHKQRMAKRQVPMCECDESLVMVLRNGCHAVMCEDCWLADHPDQDLPALSLLPDEVCN